ncbi:MAG TPA: hypothetical protein VD995_31995 [Azospirillum sp.]|nr:hypothetical protein [Azospirillum sp.]
MPKAILFALSALLLASCVESGAPKPLAAAPPPAPSSAPDSEAACAQAGGRWEKGGMRGLPLCFQDYADAGEACTKGGECQGRCIVQADGSGRCQETRPRFGCFRYFDQQGRVIGLCAD